MKYIYTLLLAAMAISIQAQDVNPIYKSIEKSDFKKLIAHLDDPVEVCFNDEQDILDKPDAVVAIRSYLKNLGIISITQIHKGTSKNRGSQYRVAKLNTKSGNYRLFLYLEKARNSFIIKEIRIDPET